MKYFKLPLIWTVASIVLALFYQFDFQTLYILIVLAMLEIALSFDNAVVNAEVLKTMSVQWQRRFIVWGIPIAVFGMRFLLPLLIAWGISGLSFFKTIQIAFNPKDTHLYAHYLHLAYPLMSGFGGAFLLMVAVRFFLDLPESGVKWIKSIENSLLLKFFKKYPWAVYILTFLMGGMLLFYLPAQNRLNFGASYLLGILIQNSLSLLHRSLSQKINFNSNFNSKFSSNIQSITHIANAGLIGFLYLELLDASFSLDGVVGAFTVSNNIVLIMLGLGIGAVCVRAMTLLFLERKVLSRLKFLAHGAHYSILYLSLIMLLKNFMVISEWLIGGVTLGIILISIFSSVMVD